MYNKVKYNIYIFSLWMLLASISCVKAQGVASGIVSLNSYVIPLDQPGVAIGKIIKPEVIKGNRVKLSADTSGLFRISKDGIISLRKGTMVNTESGPHAYGITLKIASAYYHIELVRNEFIRNKVIAHRGAWRQAGVMQNSIRSFLHAANLGCEGSEFDVWLTKDKEVVLSHDPHIGGLSVEESTAKDLYSSTLSGGDPVPRLIEFIQVAKQQNKTKMILEIKSSPTGRSLELTDSVLSIVHRLKAQGYISYISFDYEVLKRIRQLDPSAETAYLYGNKTVDELKRDGISGLDYDFYQYGNDPMLVEKAKRLELSTNVWTVNEAGALRKFLHSGVDLITTDEPEILLQLIQDEKK